MTDQQVEGAPQRRASFQLSADAEVLQARLIKCFREPRGSDYVLTYEALSDLMGTDIQKDHNLSSKLTRVIRRVERELEIKLQRDAIRGGVVRVPEKLVGVVGDQISRRVRRQARRGAAEVLRMGNLPHVPDEVRYGLLARHAQLGAIAAFAGKPTLARLEDQVKAAGGEPLPLKRTLEAFGGRRRAAGQS